MVLNDRDCCGGKCGDAMCCGVDFSSGFQSRSSEGLLSLSMEKGVFNGTRAWEFSRCLEMRLNRSFGASLRENAAVGRRSGVRAKVRRSGVASLDMTNGICARCASVATEGQCGPERGGQREKSVRVDAAVQWICWRLNVCSLPKMWAR